MPLFKASPLLAIIGILVLASAFLIWPKQNAPEFIATTENSFPPSEPYLSQSPFSPSSPLLNTPSPSSISPAPALPSESFVEPVENFVRRVTKKPFGIYIDPKNSPVQPERFTGYHTGADAEYTDITADVPVRSITAGTVRSARRSNGYGGVVVIEHIINNQPHLGIYGHHYRARLIKENNPVAAGETIGYLGQDKSDATDGERKHLHLAILVGTKLDLRGYVPKQADLSAWLNPLNILFSTSTDSP